MIILLFFFFFKHKTAYEMRISDWSSDVCSSDLIAGRLEQQLPARQPAVAIVEAAAGDDVPQKAVALGVDAIQPVGEGLRRAERPGHAGGRAPIVVIAIGQLGVAELLIFRLRSEEHTSELQSLMRISYAVFCLKKKNQHQIKRKIAHT